MIIASLWAPNPSGHRSARPAWPHHRRVRRIGGSAPRTPSRPNEHSGPTHLSPHPPSPRRSIRSLPRQTAGALSRLRCLHALRCGERRGELQGAAVLQCGAAMPQLPAAPVQGQWAPGCRALGRWAAAARWRGRVILRTRRGSTTRRPASGCAAPRSGRRGRAALLLALPGTPPLLLPRPCQHPAPRQCPAVKHRRQSPSFPRAQRTQARAAHHLDLQPLDLQPWTRPRLRGRFGPSLRLPPPLLPLLPHRGLRLGPRGGRTRHHAALTPLLKPVSRPRSTPGWPSRQRWRRAGGHSSSRSLDHSLDLN